MSIKFIVKFRLIYNSRNLLMKFEMEGIVVTSIIYNSRNLLMKFEKKLEIVDG